MTVIHNTANKANECLGSLFCSYGYLEQLVSNRFVLEEFARFFGLLWSKKFAQSSISSIYKWVSERFVQSLKLSLKASNGLPLHKRVCDFLLKYQTSVHVTTGWSNTESVTE